MKFDKKIRTHDVAALLLLVVGSVAMRVHAEQETQQSQEAAQQTDTKKDSAARGKEVEGFTMSLKAKKNKYTVGEAVDLDVVFKNTSRDNVQLLNPSILRTYKLEIIRPDGTLAPLSALAEKRLKKLDITGWAGGLYNPGDKHEIPMRANAYYDMNQIGEYQLSVSRSVPKRPENRKDENDKEATLVSNVITVRVEAPKAKDAATLVDDAEATADATQKDDAEVAVTEETPD